MGPRLLTAMLVLGPSVVASGRLPAPHFCLHSHEGETHSLSGKPGRILVLNFWATWCEPCRREIPLLNRLHAEYGPRGVDFAGVAMDARGWQVVSPYVVQHRIEYPILLFTPKMAQSYGDLDSLPRTLFLDREGKVAASVNRVLDEESFRRVIELLLAETSHGTGHRHTCGEHDGRRHADRTR